MQHNYTIPTALLLLGAAFCKQHPEPRQPAYPALRPLVYQDSIRQLAPTPRAVSNALIPVQPDTALAVGFGGDMLKALQHQLQYLQRSETNKELVPGIERDEMAHTLKLLQACSVQPGGALSSYFDFYQVNTDLNQNKVRITGYYTPIITASKTKTPEYSVPMLRWPKEIGNIPVPSPAAINQGALANHGLELAWIKSKKELRNAQLQGSCLVQFPDGEKQFLGFGGSVKGPGGSYVFFTKVGNEVLGSGTFPLTAGYSAAIDPRFIPIGATLLAELPVCDRTTGHVTCYEYRIIFAQDRGGAIKTTKRLDLYSGIGQEGLEAAKGVNSYGRLWLMLPKQE